MFFERCYLLVRQTIYDSNKLPFYVLYKFPSHVVHKTFNLKPIYGT